MESQQSEQKLVTNASKVDLELKKAFQELQSKKLEAQQKLRSADIQAEFHRQFLRRCELTKQELLTFPADMCTYESVGRMFVKQTLVEAVKQLDEKMLASEEKITSLDVKSAFDKRNLSTYTKKKVF